MKNLKRIIAVVLMVILAVSPVISTSLPSLSSMVASAATTIKLNATSKTLNPKQTYTLKLSGTTKSVYWGSSKPSVATVSSKGVVTAKSEGTANVIAISNGVAYTCKITVATPKINKTSVSIAAGKTYTLSVTGTSQPKTWSSSNTSIATVDKNGKVTAKKVGTATITCKLSTGQIFICKVNITKATGFSSSNIAVTKYNTGKGIVCVLKNNNLVNARVEVTVLYYDSKGNLIDQHSDENYCLQANNTAALKVSGPYDSHYNNIKYASYNVKIKAEKVSTSYKSNVGAISISTTNSKSTEKVIATVKNTGKSELDTVALSILYFDSNENLIGYDDSYANCEKAGSTDYVNFDYPYDSSYNTIVPHSFKIYVNSAYSYSW